MKEIPLTQNKVALVDDCDYEFLMQWKWYACKYKHTYYAVRSGFRESRKFNKVWMHRVLLELSDNNKLQGDHKDRNGLNNQRNNLRISNQSQNNANRKYSHPSRSSKYIGVTYRIKRKRYEAVIGVNHKKLYLGMYYNEIDAAKAYNNAAIKYFGEFARLNEIPMQLNA